MKHAILITGGARRLGAAMARALAAAGYTVIIHANSSAGEAHVLAAALGGHAVVGDLGQNPERIFEQATCLAGPLHGLINNASHFMFDRPGTVTAQSIAAHMAPNLVAPVLLAQAFATQPGLGGGVVINILDHKLQNLNPDFFSYTLSKAALAAATEMMAMAFAPAIRVCAIAPGLTLPGPKQTPESFDRAWRTAPLGHGATPEDIARAALFILQTPSLTGTTITVDGGEHLLHRGRDVAFLAPD